MFEIAWGLSLHSGRVVSAESRQPAICPCCRQSLSHTGLAYHHPPTRTCSIARVEQALAWRIAMARLSSSHPPQLRERCVSCGDLAGTQHTFDSGRPAGCGAVWVMAGLTLRLGGASTAVADEIRIRPREILTSESACWDAVARQKCAPCAASQQRLDAADHAYQQATALRLAAAQRAHTKSQALDRAAARWGLTAAWGPYRLEPRDCAACGASVVSYRWSGATPPSPRPRVVCPDGQQRCAACDEQLP